MITTRMVRGGVGIVVATALAAIQAGAAGGADRSGGGADGEDCGAGYVSAEGARHYAHRSVGRPHTSRFRD